MNPLVGILSPAARKTLYAVYGLAGLCVGAVQVWCASTSAHQPSWVDGGLAVLAYIGVALGFTAASNVPTPDTDEPGGDGEAGHINALEAALLVLVVIVILMLLSGHGLRL